MMIKFSPFRMDEELTAVRVGDVLNLNGEDFDFGQLVEGATLPQQAITSKWFADPVNRVDGELLITLVLPHGPNAPESTRFPQPIEVTGDGPVELPIYDVIPAPASEVPVALQDPEQRALILTKNSTGEQWAIPATKVSEANE